jgi:hypothetical protein
MKIYALKTKPLATAGTTVWMGIDVSKASMSVTALNQEGEVCFGPRSNTDSRMSPASSPAFPAARSSRSTKRDRTAPSSCAGSVHSVVTPS